MFRDPITGEVKNGIAEVRYSHAAMIDLIVANPAISQNELARHFGRTPAWVSLVVRSDAFQAALAERKAELIDPQLRATIEERFKAIAHEALDRVLQKLTGPLPPDDKFLLEAAKLSASALGYGARPQAGGNAAVGVVINLPGVSSSSSDWATKYNQGVVVEAPAPSAPSSTPPAP